MPAEGGGLAAGHRPARVSDPPHNNSHDLTTPQPCRNVKEPHMVPRKVPALNRLLFFVCCGGVFAMSAIGCEKSSSKLVQVEGKVTFRGQPVPRGFVTF